jgi:hypothetical protein
MAYALCIWLVKAENQDGYRTCGGVAYAPVGPPCGFLTGKGVAPNKTKAWVLSALADGVPKSLRELKLLCPTLTTGQIAGSLGRLQDAKPPYVTAGELVGLVPQGRGRRYSITARGAAWVQWAAQVGLVRATGAKEV